MGNKMINVQNFSKDLCYVLMVHGISEITPLCENAIIEINKEGSIHIEGFRILADIDHEKINKELSENGADYTFYYKNEKTENKFIENVHNIIDNQQEKGLKKYGTLVNKEDYSMLGWIEHAQQEAADLLIYLEVIKSKVKDVIG